MDELTDEQKEKFKNDFIQKYNIEELNESLNGSDEDIENDEDWHY